MSSGTAKISKDTSDPKGGVSFQTFRELLKQREALDHQILKFQGRLFRKLEKQLEEPARSRKTYVPRMKNTTILKDAIRECMIKGRKMTMNDILEALQKKDLYHTKSGYFYTMVNNKLNRDPLIEKVSRGVFVLQKSGQKKAS